MLLKKVRIRNFRSISDTTCNISKVITLLAGKNESGKSNILAALTSLNSGARFTSDDNPIGSEDDPKNPEVEFHFVLTQDDFEEILSNLNFEITKIKYQNEVIITTHGKTYEISGKFYETIEEKFMEFKNKDLEPINKTIFEINEFLKKFEIEPIPFITEMTDETIPNIVEIIKNRNSSIPRIKPTKENPHPEQHPEIEEIEKLLNLTEAILDNQTEINLEETIWKLRPKIILFSSDKDILPSSVPMDILKNPEELENNFPIVRDFIKLAKLDIEKLNIDDRQKLVNLADKAATITTGKFSNFWKQNKIEFYIGVDPEMITILVRDEGSGDSIRPEQRSEGFQWFLSFYLRLESSAGESNNIILVDEPGLFLHAAAQKDVLKVLEKLSETNQIIFSTHSPYLIDTKHLNRVRLVIKENYKTIITNNFHEGSADPETLTPIITAIGLDISQDLFFNPSHLNIVTEGVSDYYYLRGIIEHLKSKENYQFPENITFIPCFGNATVGLMVSFLTGIGWKYKILLDQKGLVKEKNKLIRDGIDEDLIIIAGNTKEESIENLFIEDDRIKFCTDDKSISKGIIAKEFYENIIADEIILSSETISNFKKILEKISSGIDKSSE